MIVGIAASDDEGNLMIQVEDFWRPEDHIETFIRDMEKYWHYELPVANIVCTGLKDADEEITDDIERELFRHYGLEIPE